MGLDIFYDWIRNGMANLSRYLILFFSLILFSNSAFAVKQNACLSYSPSDDCEMTCSDRNNNPTYEGMKAVFISPFYSYNGACQTGYDSDFCPDGGTLNTITGSCEEPPKTEQECNENGQLYYNSQCFDECPNGSIRLDGLCLPQQNTDECDSSSPDYQGTINNTAICSGQSNCGEGETYGQIATGDTNAMVCIPDDYGPPDCEIGTAQLTEYGFVCASSKDAPEEPEEPKLPTEPDDDNNDGVVDQQEIEQHEKELKEELRNERIQREKREKEALKQDKKQTDKLGNLEVGISELNGQVKGISDKLDNIGGDLDTSRLGSSFEFGVTTARLKTITLDNPKIARFMSIPTIATNSSCPVYTIPSTKFWDAMPVSIHCDVFANNAGMLSAVFMAVWSFVAVRVFLSS